MADVGSTAPDFTLTGALSVLRIQRSLWITSKGKISSGDLLSARLLAGLLRTDS